MEAHRRRIQRQSESGAPLIPMDMIVDNDSDDESMTCDDESAREASTTQPASVEGEGKHPAAERRHTMSVYAVLSPTPSSSESSPRGATAVSGLPLAAAHSLAAYHQKQPQHALPYRGQPPPPDGRRSSVDSDATPMADWVYVHSANRPGLSPTASSHHDSSRSSFAASTAPTSLSGSPPLGPAHGVRLPPIAGERQQLPPGLHAAGCPALDRGGGCFGQRDGIASGMATESEFPCRAARLWAYRTGDCTFR